MKPLCPACREARARWLDYRLPSVPGFAHGSGASYDVSPAGQRDRQRSRFEEWRRTIRFHMDLIADTCRAADHATAEPAAQVVQLDLLAVLDADGGPQR